MSNTKPPFVLFADDNADILEMLALGARRRGWKVDTAGSAEEMLHRISESCQEGAVCYDAVVSDIRFVSEIPGVPMLDGVSALRQVRKRLPDLPFIFLTAFAEPMTVSEIKKMGSEVEEKPVDLARFLDRVETAAMMSRPAVVSPAYVGEDRRKKSINRSGNFRRRTDPAIEIGVPRVLQEAHDAMGRKAHG